MRFIFRSIRKERGFTLIEMLIVIAIIGVFLALALPDYKGTVAKAQEKSCKVSQRLILTALESYYMDNGNKYPSETDALSTLQADHYLQAIPTCPSGGTYSVKIAPDGKSIQVLCSVHTK